MNVNGTSINTRLAVNHLIRLDIFVPTSLSDSPEEVEAEEDPLAVAVSGLKFQFSRRSDPKGSRVCG